MAAASDNLYMGPVQAAHDAISFFFHYLDADQGDKLQELFDDNSTLEVLKSGKTYTKSQVGATFLPEVREMMRRNFGPDAAVVHIESNIVLGKASNFITNVSYWTAFADGEIVAYGQHNDLLLYNASTDSCVFRNRKITHTWSKK